MSSNRKAYVPLEFKIDINEDQNSTDLIMLKLQFKSALKKPNFVKKSAKVRFYKTETYLIEKTNYSDFELYDHLEYLASKINIPNVWARQVALKNGLRTLNFIAHNLNEPGLLLIKTTAKKCGLELGSQIYYPQNLRSREVVLTVLYDGNVANLNKFVSYLCLNINRIEAEFENERESSISPVSPDDDFFNIILTAAKENISCRIM